MIFPSSLTWSIGDGIWCLWGQSVTCLSDMIYDHVVIDIIEFSQIKANSSWSNSANLNGMINSWVLSVKSNFTTCSIEQISVTHSYRRQTKFAKVMLLHVSVSHSVHGGRGCWYPSIPCRSPGPHTGGSWGSGHGGSPGPHPGESPDQHPEGVSRPTSMGDGGGVV